jgi:uncharacterized protein (TIGR02594 family)
VRALFLILLLASCQTTISLPAPVAITDLAKPYVGLHERYDRAELKQLVGVDPVQIEWCAAFVNAILDLNHIPGSETVSAYPLTARSFLTWGNKVNKDDIQRGDVVVFPRGNQGWQGHVGFYIQTVIVNGEAQWYILGGNQDNTVSYQLYDPANALGIRRWQDDVLFSP